MDNLKLVEYNPEWKKSFKTEAKNIKKELGKNCSSVVHIGGTAIKGALAVSVIDMLVLTKNNDLKEITCAMLEDMGYVESGSVFLKRGDDVSYSIRLINEKEEDEYIKYISVVRYLEGNKELLNEYNKKKQEIYAITNEEQYTDERKVFFDDLQVKAMKRHEEQEHITECTSIGMCLGMSIGLLFFDNIAFGMGIGAIIGYLFGKYGDEEIDFKFGKKK